MSTRSKQYYLWDFESYWFGFVLWFFNYEVSFSFQKCNWEKWIFHFWSNKGHRSNECLDINLNIFRFAFSLTLWRINRWEWATKLLPDWF